MYLIIKKYHFKPLEGRGVTNFHAKIKVLSNIFIPIIYSSRFDLYTYIKYGFYINYLMFYVYFWYFAFSLENV